MLKKLKNIFLIGKWEFREKFFHKSFLIYFLLSQFLLFLTVYFINPNSNNNHTKVFPIALLFEPDSIDNNLLNKLIANDVFFFVKINKSDYLDSNNTFVLQNVFKENFVACLTISPDKYSLTLNNELSKRDILRIQNYVNKLINNTSELSYDLFSTVNKEIEKKLITKFSIVLIFIFTILISANMFLRGFSAEKESKLLELLLSSTSLENILLGKSLGFFIFIIIQFTVWFSISLFVDNIFISSINSFWIIILFYFEILFFIIFLLVASLLSNNDSETNIVLSTITILLLLPFIFIDDLVNFNNSIISNFLIYFPITSFPAIVLKSIKFEFSTFDILSIILILLITIIIFIFLISKYISNDQIINNIFSSNSKKVNK